MAMKSVVVLPLLLVVGLVSGCSSDADGGEKETSPSHDEPAKVAGDFLRSLADGDAKRPCSYLDPAAQDAFNQALNASECPTAVLQYRAGGPARATADPKAADVTVPATGLATAPTKDAFVQGVKLTGESAAVDVGSGDVPGLTRNHHLLLINTSAGWSISAPAK